MIPPAPPPQDGSEASNHFYEGLDLFNNAEWFDAHEAWEDAWHLASGDQKRFLQGLIQCAVTLEHVRRGNPRGVRAVWRTCQTKFVDLPDRCMGIDVPDLLDRMRRTIKPILDLPAEYYDPARPRGQKLPIDWALAPRIELDPAPVKAEKP